MINIGIMDGDLLAVHKRPTRAPGKSSWPVSTMR